MENMNYGSRQQQPVGAATAVSQTEAKTKQAAANFNVKDLLMLILINWYWFVISALIGGGLAYLYIQTIQPEYQRVSDIQIKTSRDDGLDMRSVLGMNNNVTNMTNELYILKSLKLAREVANKTRMDVRYYKEGTFRRSFLYANRPFTVVFNNEYLHDLLIGVKLESAQTYSIESLFINGEKQVLTDNQMYFFGSTVKLPVSEEEIVISVSDDNYPYLVENMDKVVYVSRTNLDNAARLCQSMITAESRASSMIRIICTASSVAEADDVLRGVTEVYKEQAVQEKNAMTINSVNFVEERIQETARELGENASKLNASGVVTGQKKGAAEAQASMAAASLGERSSAANQVSAINSNLDMARSIRARVQQSIAAKDYIPVLPGLAEAGVSGQITAYNNQIQQRNRLVENSSIENPAVRKMDAALGQQEMTMISTIDAYIETLEAEVKLASGRLARASAYAYSANKKQSFDSTAIEAQSLVISQEYKQEYFSFLLKRREELRLELAVANADARVVEDPMGSADPISPIPKAIYSKFIIVAVALPAVVLFLIVLLTSTVRGRKDVEDLLSMPFLGEIPDAEENPNKQKITLKKKKDKHRSGSRLVINNTSRNLVSEAFRIVQSNLSFMECDEKGTRPQTIMFTSFAPGAGKSFVSINLASCLANSENKRSIWIDLDIRKGHKNNDLMRQDLIPNKRIGLSSYLAGKAELDECIIESCSNECLDVMVAGPIPPNPVQLFMSERFDEMIKILRKRYEYIILDSVPATVVADAAICNRVADLTIYVLRVGVTERRVLPEIEKLYQQHKFNNMCALLNGAIVSKRYGYATGSGGYGYGYGYGYG